MEASGLFPLGNNQVQSFGENMASRFSRSCSPAGNLRGPLRVFAGPSASLLITLLFCAVPPPASAQFQLKPAQLGEAVTLMPSDTAILESGEARKDLPCTVTPRKAELGFDLRFHSGYDVTIPLKELAGSGELLSIVFRAYPQDQPSQPAYFVQHYRVPAIDDDAKGDALLEGIVDVGEGKYHVDWLMRDRAERICSSSWDVEAALSAKDKPMPLFIDPEVITETAAEPFVNDATVRANRAPDGDLNLKLLVNFAPQNHNPRRFNARTRTL